MRNLTGKPTGAIVAGLTAGLGLAFSPLATGTMPLAMAADSNAGTVNAAGTVNTADAPIKDNGAEGTTAVNTLPAAIGSASDDGATSTDDATQDAGTRAQPPLVTGPGWGGQIWRVVNQPFDLWLTVRNSAGHLLTSAEQVQAYIAGELRISCVDPRGASVAVTTTSSTISVTPSVAGTYSCTFNYTDSDSSLSSEPYQATYDVVEQVPVSNMPNITVHVGETVNLLNGWTAVDEHGNSVDMSRCATDFDSCFEVFFEIIDATDDDRWIDFWADVMPTWPYWTPTADQVGTWQMHAGLSATFGGDFTGGRITVLPAATTPEPDDDLVVVGGDDLTVGEATRVVVHAPNGTAVTLEVTWTGDAPASAVQVAGRQAVTRVAGEQGVAGQAIFSLTITQPGQYNLRATDGDGNVIGTELVTVGVVAPVNPIYPINPGNPVNPIFPISPIWPWFPGFPGGPWGPGFPGFQPQPTTPGKPTAPGTEHPVTGVEATWLIASVGLLGSAGAAALVTQRRRAGDRA